jgi:hypothetical protein
MSGMGVPAASISTAVLAVGLVVLVIVRDQIVEGKAIVAAGEIDALLCLALLVAIEVRTPQEP